MFEFVDGLRVGLFEVAVFALAVSVATHVDRRPKQAVIGV